MIAAELYRYRLPLRTPLRLSTGPLTHREGALLRLADTAGAEGWGDAAPLPGFSRETLDECLAALAEAVRVSADTTHAGGLASPGHPAWRVAARSAAARFALESAGRMLDAARLGVAVYRFGRDRAHPVLPAAALLTGPREQVLARAAEARAAGYRNVKLKLGAGGPAQPDDDLRLIDSVFGEIGDGIAVRVDANRAWDVSAVLRFEAHTRGRNIEYVEEPLRDPAELPMLLMPHAAVRYAVDESLREAAWNGTAGAQAAAWRGAAAIVWKPSLSSLGEICAWAHPAERSSLPIVFSAAFESGVGLAAIAQRPEAQDRPDVAVGLDTYRFLAEDVLESPLPCGGPSLNLDAMDAAARAVRMSRLERVRV